MTTDATGVRVVDQARRDLDALPSQAPAPRAGKPDECACAAHFLLTRVTRIFQKSVFTKPAPAGTGGTWLPTSLLPARRRRERNLQVQAAVVGSVPLFPDCY